MAMQLVDHDLGEAEDRLLRAERRDDLGAGIDTHVKAPVDPPGDRVAQLRQARRARIRGDLVDRCKERLADERRRQLPRIAHAEVDQVDAASLRLGLPVVQPRKWVLGEIREDGGELHA
jgi:hypothetical protein